MPSETTKVLERIAIALEKTAISKEKKIPEIKKEDEFLATQAFSLKNGRTIVYGINKYTNKDPQIVSLVTKKTPYEAEKAMLESLTETAHSLGLVSHQVIQYVSNPFLHLELSQGDRGDIVLLSEEKRLYINKFIQTELRLEHSES